MSDYVKSTAGVLNYTIDWTTWLDGDTIATSTWAIDNNDAGSLVIDSESETTAAATATISGGTKGKTYEITNTITTAAGLTDTRTMALHINTRRI